MAERVDSYFLFMIGKAYVAINKMRHEYLAHGMLTSFVYDEDNTHYNNIQNISLKYLCAKAIISSKQDYSTVCSELRIFIEEVRDRRICGKVDLKRWVELMSGDAVFSYPVLSISHHLKIQTKLTTKHISSLLYG